MNIYNNCWWQAYYPENPRFAEYFQRLSMFWVRAGRRVNNPHFWGGLLPAQGCRPKTQSPVHIHNAQPSCFLDSKDDSCTHAAAIHHVMLCRRLRQQNKTVNSQIWDYLSGVERPGSAACYFFQFWMETSTHNLTKVTWGYFPVLQ